MLPLPPLSDPPSDIPEGGPVMSRRRAGLALLGTALSLTACGQPAEEIVPYVEQPENVVPGVPMRYATALTLNGYARGVIATCFEGRPVKLEGNAAHPGSLGGTDAFTEAAILSLYDPDRSRAVRQGIRIAPRDALFTALLPQIRKAEARGGRSRSAGGRAGVPARAYRPQPRRTTSPDACRARRWPVTLEIERPTWPAISPA